VISPVDEDLFDGLVESADLKVVRDERADLIAEVMGVVLPAEDLDVENQIVPAPIPQDFLHNGVVLGKAQDGPAVEEIGVEFRRNVEVMLGLR
jgi:hypothetical protein